MMAGRNRSRGVAATALALVLVLGVPGCDDPVAASLPVAVRVEPLAVRVFRNETPFSGTVKERHRVEFSFKVPGTVKELLQVDGPDGFPHDVQEGDRVALGAALARLDDVSTTAATATLPGSGWGRRVPSSPRPGASWPPPSFCSAGPKTTWATVSCGCPSMAQWSP
jgi:multidrug efflux pump subunit AcrA (membrane-fusion protein)